SHFVLYLLPSPSSLFPYTTLFRSFTVPLLPLPVRGELRLWETQVTVDFVSCNFVGHFVVFSALDAGIVIDKVLGIVRWLSIWARSEEHTSELQSRFDLVCRLLLAK